MSMCEGEDPAGMGLILLANYEMDEVIAAGWDVAYSREAFPG